MKNNNPQLDDAMILQIADAHTEGVDFSRAVQIAKIPSTLTEEAKKYWNILDKQNEIIHQIFPEDSILESIFERMNSPVSERIIKEAAPSPYMKYVMAFAVPVSIFVMIIGVTFRKDSNIDPIANDENFAPMAAMSSEIQDSNVLAPKVAKQMIDNTNGIATPSAANARMMAISATVSEPEEIKKSDPKQLIAMLTNTGSFEAESDTSIDEEFDAKLSELDSIVIDSNNINPYENQ